MTTLEKNISHQKELFWEIDDLIDRKGKYCSIDQGWSLNFDDIDRDDQLNLCRLAIECKDRHLEDTFCNDGSDNVESTLLNVLHSSRYKSSEEDVKKYIEATKDAVIIENKHYLEDIIEERCKEKMINQIIDGDLYNHYYG